VLKLVYPICCGVDVHKKFIIATIVKTDNQGLSEYLQERFDTIPDGIKSFYDWLVLNNCFNVCMESTGKYWIPIFNYLETDMNIVLTHPKYVRSIKGKKTDKKDSKWIADLFRYDLVRNSFIPPKPIREIREIARYRYKLVAMKVSEKNRIQNSMTISNIRMESVLSDPFGVTATQIMKYLLKTREFNENECRKLIKGQAKKKSDLIIDSIKDYKISTDQELKLTLATSHLEILEKLIADTEVELFVRTRPYKKQIDLITQLPGIQEKSAELIISEIGADMTVFDSADQLSSWAGLTPTNNESAGKKKSNRVTKAGKYIKPLLVQCALASIRSKNTYFSVKYYNIRKRRGHKKAIIAVARMMLVSIYHMLKDMVDFNPTDYEEFINPKPKKEITINKALAFLAEQGIDISVLNLDLVNK